MLIRPATLADLPRIMPLYAAARQFMQRNGNPQQWIAGYPSLERITADIQQQHSYLIERDAELLGVFYFAVEDEPTYALIEGGRWLNEQPYGVIHRLASSGVYKGLAQCCFDWCFEQHPNLRIDTHADNLPMQRAIRRYGFADCGVIRVANGDARLAFQKTDLSRLLGSC